MTTQRDRTRTVPLRPRDRQMLCEVLMETQVEWLSPDESVAVATRRMHKHGENFLPVCGRSGKVLGVVTARDIAVGVAAEGLPPTAPVSRVMKREFVACAAQDDIGIAEKLMQVNNTSRILCLDEFGRLEGIMSLAVISRSSNDSRSARNNPKPAPLSATPSPGKEHSTAPSRRGSTTK